METNESIAKAYKEMWDKIPNAIPNRVYTLTFSQQDWFLQIDLNVINLTKEQVIAAKDHPKGFIGNANGVDCYLTTKQYRDGKM